MYSLTPLKIYALDRVREDPVCLGRMERMLQAIKRAPGDVVWITPESLPDVVKELAGLWPPETVPPGCVRSYMRPLVFTTMELRYPRPDIGPILRRCPEGTPPDFIKAIHGHLTTAEDQHPHSRDQKENFVCWPTYNFGTMRGCPHGCTYCGDGREGKFIAIALNLEEYMEKVVGPIIESNPWSKVFRMILNGADLIAFEPEYGLHDLFTRKLAQYEDRWGHFHTSSANVEWMADLPHRDRLVGVWSVSCDAVARDFEPGAGPVVERYKAARKCQEMGIPVRFKYKPIIPIRGWREAYSASIEQALKIAGPESIGFCLYAWNSYESMTKALDTELLDPECVDAARLAADEMEGRRCGPFPHDVRREIYRFFIREVRRWDKDVLLYISTETREMWDELKDELGQDPRCYICACSSVAVPGRRLALSPGFRYSTYNRTPV